MQRAAAQPAGSNGGGGGGGASTSAVLAEPAAVQHPSHGAQHSGTSSSNGGLQQQHPANGKHANAAAAPPPKPETAAGRQKPSARKQPSNPAKQQPGKHQRPGKQQQQQQQPAAGPKRPPGGAAPSAAASGPAAAAARQLLREWQALQDSRPPAAKQAATPHPKAIALVERAIQGASTLDELEAILDALEGRLLHHGVTAAAVRLAQLVRGDRAAGADAAATTSTSSSSASSSGDAPALSPDAPTATTSGETKPPPPALDARHRWRVQGKLLALLSPNIRHLSALQVGLLLRALPQLDVNDAAVVRRLQARGKHVMGSATEPHTLSMMVAGAVRLAGAQAARRGELRARLLQRRQFEQAAANQQQHGGGSTGGEPAPAGGGESGSSSSVQEQQQPLASAISGTAEEQQQPLVRSSRRRTPEQQRLALQRAATPQEPPAPARPSRAFVDAWLQQSQQHLASFSPAYLATSVHSLALAGQRPPDEWTAAFLAAAEKLLVESAAGDGSSSSSSSSSASITTTDANITTANTTTASGGQAAARRFSASDLSKLLWSLARLGVRPPDAWFASYRAACRGVYWTMGGADVARVIWSTGRLGLPVSEAWTRDMLWQAQRTLKGASTRQLAALAWALAAMRVRPAAAWVQRYCKLVSQLGLILCLFVFPEVWFTTLASSYPTNPFVQLVTPIPTTPHPAALRPHAGRRPLLLLDSPLRPRVAAPPPGPPLARRLCPRDAPQAGRLCSPGLCRLPRRVCAARVRAQSGVAV